MSMPLEEQIRSLIEAGEGGNVVSATKQVLHLLKEHKVSYEARLHPNIVGVHSQNRDGVGVLPSQVHKLLTDIVDLGFSEEVIMAVCTESTPKDRSFNTRLTQASGGALPAYAVEDMVKYCSLGASHTNQALRCILGQVSHTDNRLTIDGVLNHERVLLQDRELARVCKEGLKWVVLPSQLLSDHPKLASMIQCGLNASGQIIRAESEVQVLRRIHTLWLEESAQSADQRVEFGAIQARVQRSKPPCGQYLHHMYNFLLRRCGGRDAGLLELLELFVGAQTSEPKSLGGEMFDVLSSDVRGLVNQYTLVRHALFKYATVHGLTARDAKRVLSDKQAEVVEGILAEFSDLIQTGLLTHDIINIMGRFEMAAIGSILGKRHDSVHLCAHDFILEWNAHAGHLTPAGVQVESRFEELCAIELKAREDKPNRLPSSSHGVSYGSQL